MKILETIKIEGKDMVIYEIDDHPEWITYGWHVDNFLGSYSHLPKGDENYLEDAKQREKEFFIKRYIKEKNNFVLKDIIKK